MELLTRLLNKLNLKKPNLVENRIFIGIDTGINGGVAFLYNDVYKAVRCPATVSEMADVLRNVKDVAPNTPVYCVIEKVHSMPNNSGRSMFTFGCNYGQWLGILATLKIPYIEVTPQKWMKWLGALPKDRKDRKNRLKHLAQQRYPESKVTLATADALLIATYLKETNTQ